MLGYLLIFFFSILGIWGLVSGVGELFKNQYREKKARELVEGELGKTLLYSATGGYFVGYSSYLYNLFLYEDCLIIDGHIRDYLSISSVAYHHKTRLGDEQYEIVFSDVFKGRWIKIGVGGAFYFYENEPKEVWNFLKEKCQPYPKIQFSEYESIFCIPKIDAD